MKIGVYDSGIGGLFILFSLIKRYPNHHFIYLGDQANAPYGTKDKDTLLSVVETNLKWFEDIGADKVIIACNTACSSGALDIKIDGLITEGIIDKTVDQINCDQSCALLVLATPLTIKNQVYQNLIKNKGYANVFGFGLDELAGLIENNASTEILETYLRHTFSTISFKPDCVILGCTHYPLVKKSIENYFKVPIVDSNLLVFDLEKEQQQVIEIYSTKQPDIMEKQIERIFNEKIKVKYKNENCSRIR